MPEPPFPQAIGEPFVELVSVDSTNNYALAHIHAGLAQHGVAFFAHEQLAGKGQRGKIWTSEKDSNLILSLVFNPAPLRIPEQFQLSALVAVSVCEMLTEMAGPGFSIKWPNDIYWQDRKAGGILIENLIGGQSQSSAPDLQQGSVWKWAVVGMGININQASFPPGLKNPVSLRQITGKQFNPVQLARTLCSLIDTRWKSMLTTGFEPLFDEYVQRLFMRDELVKFKAESRVFEARVKTITRSGKLVIQHSMEEEFGSGQLEWLNLKSGPASNE